MRKPVWTLLGVVLVVLLTAEVAAADQAVTAEPSNVFAPADVTISQGERVSWTNNGGTHDVHFEDGFEQPADPTPDQHAPKEIADRRHSHARVGRVLTVVSMGVAGRFLTGHDGPNDISR